MKWARIINNKVIEIFNFNPNEWIKNDEFLANCELVPDEVQQNWIKENGEWLSHEQQNAKNIIYEEIQQLKSKLTETDYKAIKYAEGILSDEEYAETKAQRQEWRDKINQLESEV